MHANKEPWRYPLLFRTYLKGVVFFDYDVGALFHPIFLHLTVNQSQWFDSENKILNKYPYIKWHSLLSYFWAIRNNLYATNRVKVYSNRVHYFYSQCRSSMTKKKSRPVTTEHITSLEYLLCTNDKRTLVQRIWTIQLKKFEWVQE